MSTYLMSDYEKEQISNNADINNNLDCIGINISEPSFNAKGDGKADDTMAIIKAINVAVSYGKGSTVICSPGKIYSISKYINIPNGINFNGNGAIFKPIAGSTFTNNFMFGINTANAGTWDVAYPTYHGTVKNITIDNTIANINGLKGILIGAGYTVHHINSIYMYQTITKIAYYLDMVDIHHIDIGVQQGNLFQIDCSNIGDALHIKHVHTHDWVGTNYNLIQVQYANGAIIEDIINGNITILNGMATLRNVHLESGAVTQINAAINWDTGVIFKTPGIVPIVNKNAPASGYQRKMSKISNVLICYLIDRTYATEEFDIDLSGSYGFLTLENVFRTRWQIGVIDNTQLTGIKVSDAGSSLTAFNNYSQVYSTGCKIKSSILTDKVSASIPTANIYVQNAIFGTAPVVWQLAGTATYYYKYQVLVDTIRMCGRGDSAGEQSVSLTSGSTGAGLQVQSDLSFQGCKLRIYRGTTTSSYDHYVDIPIIEAGGLMYDDGLQICGWFWQTRTAGVADLYFNPSQYHYNGLGNVECVGTAVATVGTWIVGDRIKNIPVVGQPKAWICTVAGTPGTWVSEGNL